MLTTDFGARLAVMFRARVYTSAVTLLAVASCVYGSVITFTGNVANDFPSSDPSVFIATDNIVIDYNGSPAGWQMTDVRYSYDLASDTAYFGT